MNLTKKWVAVLAACVSPLLWTSVNVSHATADTCRPVWSVGIGGLNDNTSSVFVGRVDQTVGYNSLDAISGIRELDRLIQKHRGQCPRDHIKILGHSQGAAIVHVWVTEHQRFTNANSVLLADPKRWAPGFGGPGMSSRGGFLGYPLAGVDDWFGDFPTLTICRWDDWVCNLDAPWGQSHFTGSHGWYNFNASFYSSTGRGPRMV